MIIKYLKLKRIQSRWFKKNAHNKTLPVSFFDISLVDVGKETYGDISVLTNNTGQKLHIGAYCSIAPDVLFVLNSDHPLNHISSYPFKVKVLKSEKHEALSKGDIVINDDVWIGCRSTILSGVHIGQGAIIAAGAVVSKDVPPYAIVGGVPAKVIKYRFPDELIQELMKVDYSKLTREMVREHIEDLYSELQDIRQLSWMPKKQM